MKSHALSPLLCTLALTLGAGVPMAHASTAAAIDGPPLARTTCKDYLAMDEAARPKFIQAAAQVAQKDVAKKVTSIIVDKLGVEERLKPDLDTHCKLHPEQSAYERVMQSVTAPKNTGQ